MRVDLHFDRLDLARDEVDGLVALLDPAEGERARQFHQAFHRTRFIVRRARLRQWLGAQLNLDPAAVTIATDARGKPFVPGWNRHFSASHSGDTMLIAKAPAPVGCDIEAMAPAFDWRPVAERLFAREERESLAALAEDPGRTAFFRCWARKEAYVKALGHGLAHPLDAFAVRCSPQPGFVRGGRGWAMGEIDRPGYAVAIVAQNPSDELEIVIR